MKIVVLDGYTLNPGDLSWEELKTLGEVVIYDRTPKDQVVERAKDAPILITNKTILDRENLQHLPQVKYIGVLATGYNVVDVDYCQEKGIVVTNVPGYGPKTVAQMVFAHILELTNRVYAHHLSVIEGEWSRALDFCYWKYPLVELSGKTLGIIGFGQIGREVARIGQAFGMNILVKTRSIPKEVPEYVKLVSLEELITQSDVISLNCPLTKETENLVNEDFLKAMKPSAYLINCSRGQLVDEQALVKALKEGQIAGAGVDVLSQEPPPANHPFFTCPNLHLTPHIAWATKEARQRLLDIAVDNLRSFLQGKVKNRVV
ncbi:MAG: Lactate dehydrogenase-like oxidoreductase [Desulfonauticus sp. 38_4375]|jgi:glycerate dehydrogenase|nr:MAG: Lactate dehydrogenase-like oxidoreductase [Desulfonauticus sp. 38_4375]